MNKNTICLGSDHAGYELKQKINTFLVKKGYRVKDMGPHSYDSDDDYPDYALKVCRNVIKTKGRGVLICGSGQGMDRAANKIPGIYASVCWNKESALVAKEHGNINVLCLGGRLVSVKNAKDIIEIWLKNRFKGETRHIRRINKIRLIEKSYAK